MKMSQIFLVVVYRIEQLKSSHLLRRYLEIKYGSPCQAAHECAQIISKLEELRQMAVGQVEIFGLLKPDELTPLLVVIQEALRTRWSHLFSNPQIDGTREFFDRAVVQN